MCITYNRFNTDGKKLAQIDSAYHLKNLVQLILVGVITAISKSGVDSLTKDQRHVIYLLVKEHLSQLDQSELKVAIGSIKNFSDSAIEMWNKFTGPIGLVINALFERIGLGGAEIEKFVSEGGYLGSLTDRITVLQSIAAKLGYESIYLLVDKIDETGLTTTADNSYKFIAPVINDLQLLETPGIAFKFFLWNLLLDEYRKVARPDRVKYYTLEWNHDQLAQMLSERLKAFSNSSISSLEIVSDSGISLGLDLAIAISSQGSPRNVHAAVQQSPMDIQFL